MSRTVYQFKPWARLKGDAQKVGETLESIREREGTLSPAAVVAEAKPKSSVLHDYFEWNNSNAAAKYREQQAAHLIRSIVVVTSEGVDIQAPVRAFVSIRQAAEESLEEKPGTYTSIREAVRVVTYRQQMLADALRDLDAYRTRYALLTDLTRWSAALQLAREDLLRQIEEDAAGIDVNINKINRIQNNTEIGVS